jgi:hypothetical protein
MHVLPVALNHNPTPSRPPVCLQLISWRLSHEQGIAIQLFHEANALGIGIQQLIDVAVGFGNRTPVLNRTAQTAAADQVAHGVALALESVLFPNRFDQDPQANHDRQGPPQAGAGSLQGPRGPGNGERLPQQGQARGLMFAD